jgi:hypothetical protein
MFIIDRDSDFQFDGFAIFRLHVFFSFLCRHALIFLDLAQAWSAALFFGQHQRAASEVHFRSGPDSTVNPTRRVLRLFILRGLFEQTWSFFTSA